MLPARLLLPVCAAMLVYVSVVNPLMASPNTSKASFPGRLIDVGGHRLHILCEGEGIPAIILDSGTGGFSLEWAKVQKVLARRTRVCSYDRAGYGWSDMGPLPRTSGRITSELHTLLEKAGEKGPYILAGHSFGGYTAQLFASNYPGETAGLVLIDSSHPEQIERFPRRKQVVAERTRPESHTYQIFKLLLHPDFPDENVLTAHRIIQRWHHKQTWREEMKVFHMSAKQVLESRPVPAVPTTVLTRGRRAWSNDTHGDEMERVWMELQGELSKLGANPVHLIAERSGHMIHLEQPGIVISAMQTMLDANFSSK